MRPPAVERELERRLKVAKIIQQQIGNKALVMLGAWNQIAHEDGFSFRFRGSRKLNYLRIKLTPSDTYTMEFSRIGRAPDFKITNEIAFTSIYFDQLHAIIEKETGLHTRLF